MKILEIIPSLRPGGGERLVTDLCNELAKSQDVTLLTLWDDTQADYSFYKKDLSNDVKYVNARVDEKKKVAVLWSFVKHICKVKPDVVHLHMCHMFALLALLLLGWKYKFFLTIHNDVKSTYSMPKHKLIFNIFGRLGWLRFVTISQTNHEEFDKIYPALHNDLVYNGRAPLIRTNKYDEVRDEIEALKRTKDTKVFLHIARCNPQKNQKLLVGAFNQLIDEGNDVILLIIGAHFDDTEEGRELQEMACDKIYFLGTRTNVADYIYQADAFCLSSIFEGMPITLIECVNSGVPVISTPVCGVIDVIEDGRNGWISKDFTLKSYLECLYHFLEQERIDTSYGKENPFSITNCAKGYMALFFSVVKK